MKIIKITPRGYCKGVVHAINTAKKARLDNPDSKIYILGKIVHNSYVSKALSALNIITVEKENTSRLELLDEIQEGIVIFSAHGVDYRVKKKANDKGLEIIDASCIDVIKTQNNVAEHLNQGYDIIYIGKKNHPEADGILSDYKNIHLVSKLDDVKQLDLTNDKIYVTNQTTMSIIEIAPIFVRIKEIYPHALIEEEICNATRLRQNAIINIEKLDLLYVVGDITSNNSNKLKEIAESHNVKKAILIDDATKINITDLIDVESVGVTSGASTPTYLTNQVIETLEYYSSNKTLPTNIEVDVSKIIT